MKYVNKIMAVGLAILFLIALVIGTGIVLSVRNVNVSYEYYGENVNAEVYEATRKNFDSLKGSGIIFVKGDDVYSKITDDKLIAVDRYEKVFPCTINVYLRQRVKTFAVYNQAISEYSVYDEKGQLIENNVSSDGVPSGTDGCPLVLLQKVGNASLTEVAKICEYFNASFGGFSRLVESISVKDKDMTFRFRSGISLRFYPRDSHNATSIDARMVEKAYGVYQTLTEPQKLKGMIAVMYSSSAGEITANYMDY